MNAVQVKKLLKEVAKEIRIQPAEDIRLKDVEEFLSLNGKTTGDSVTDTEMVRPNQILLLSWKINMSRCTTNDRRCKV
jgi:hypothetical protein